MSNTVKYSESLATIKDKVSELDRLLNAGELGFKLNEVLSTHASLFNRFCPYKIGDRVQLKETLDIPKDSGWYDCRHFLVKGAIATVKDSGYRDDLFVFGLIFDEESWVRYDTQEVVPSKDDQKHLFYLPENWIERVI